MAQGNPNDLWYIHTHPGWYCNVLATICYILLRYGMDYLLMVERPDLDKMETWATSFDRTEMLVLIQYTRSLEERMADLEVQIEGEYDT